jgi:L-histidine N-alpha-methyltransferase
MTDILSRKAQAAAAEAHQRFADDVQFYLVQQPRQLPSRYLYDALGSALFDAICHLPWYGLTRAEERLLHAHGAEIIGRADAAPVIVELGPGSGDKLSLLLSAARRALQTQHRVHLIDISASALDRAVRAIDASGNVHVTAHETTYEEGLTAFRDRRALDERALVLFLGSNIGNFDEPAREAFLRTIRRALRVGDALLLGADLVKDERDLMLAYDDPLGVTAAFNRNLLVRINRELDGDFNLDAFSHRAVFNRKHSRIEMHLVSQQRQRVRIGDAQLDFEMQQGESIWTESSYKYTPEGIVALLEACGFKMNAQWTDAAAGFALTLARAA